MTPDDAVVVRIDSALERLIGKLAVLLDEADHQPVEDQDREDFAEVVTLPVGVVA